MTINTQYLIPVGVSPLIGKLPRWIKVEKSIFPPTNCTSIVKWNESYTIGSNLGLKKYTNFLRSCTYIHSFHLDVIIGLILSDAGLKPQIKGGNARLGFKQSMNHFPFFWSTFMLLSHYCSSLPYSDNAIIKGKKYYGIRLDTRSLPCLTILYEMFYSKGKKKYQMIYIIYLIL